jgi:PTS system beta-glucosides-specific IIC component
MDFQAMAEEIMFCIGGRANVTHLEHCSTRLRFSVIDVAHVDIARLEAIPGVLKVVNNVQCQVVIGSDVIEVYAEVVKLIGGSRENSPVKRTAAPLAARLVNFIIAVFQPLIPAMAGAGVLKSILLLLSATNVLSADAEIYQIFAAISDATFYFLPLMVAYTSADAMKSNKMVAVAAVGYLLLPSVSDKLAEGMQLFGLPLQAIAYNGQVFPAILITLFIGYLEKFFQKVAPKAIRVFFVPMMALALTIPVALVILGPLGYYMGVGLSTVILFIYDKLGFVAVALTAGILPFMVAAGMHKALGPHSITMIQSVGYEMLYLPASLGHNIAESGASFAVALKTKDNELRSVALSAGISALMGITEPALYGVTLQRKKVLLSVVLGGVVSGAFVGFVALKAFVLVGPGLPSITMFTNVADQMNLIYAFVGLVLAFMSSFFIVLLIWQDEAVVVKEGTEDAQVAVRRDVVVK